MHIQFQIIVSEILSQQIEYGVDFGEGFFSLIYPLFVIFFTTHLCHVT